MALKEKGRVTVSVHIPGGKVDFLDQMITRSGQSTSAYLVLAALQRAAAEAKDAGIAVPENIAAGLL